VAPQEYDAKSAGRRRELQPHCCTRPAECHGVLFGHREQCPDIRLLILALGSVCERADR
jgi:hypothetical protein